MKPSLYSRLGIVAFGCVCLAGAADAQDCKLTSVGTAQGAAAEDGRTLKLDDGRTLRLAGIEAGDDARALLQSLVAGQILRLETLGQDHDRYGRIVAFAFPGEARASLQEILLDQGAARVSSRVGDKACAVRLFAAEHSAREAKRGHWTDPNFAPLSAEDLAGVAAVRGRFALVEGKVLSVRQSGATIYMNFGRRWTRDFTVIVQRRLQRAFAAAGVDPDALAGRRIRVRGVVEQRGGPVIAAETPEQIELLD